MVYFQKIDDLLARVENWLAILLFSGLLLSLLLNIVSRNIFHTSYAVILESSPAMVLWLALIGASLCLKDNRHIKLELLLRFLSKKWRYTATVLTSVFGMTVMAILFWASLRFVQNETMIFGAKGLFSVIFPWFFGVACFRFFLRTASFKNNPKESK